MVLRIPNNPLDETTFLTKLRPVILPGTQLALHSPSGTGGELIYVQQMFALTQGAFPAISLYGNGEHTQRTATGSASGERTVVLEYIDRWDTQTLPIEIIRANIRLELDRIISNVQEYLTMYEGFDVSGTIIPVTLLDYSVEEYDKQPIDKYDLGMTLGAAKLFLTFAIHPYAI